MKVIEENIMKSRKWYELEITDEIKEIKELQQLLEYFQENYNNPDISYLLNKGFTAGGEFTPILFPREVSVSFVVHHASGSDVESWDMEQKMDYFEGHLMPKLNRIDKNEFSAKFKNELEKTFGLSIEEYNKIYPPEEKVYIGCQILMDLSIEGELPLLN
jgi:hypothetical protein